MANNNNVSNRERKKQTTNTQANINKLLFKLKHKCNTIILKNYTLNFAIF